MRTCLDAAQGAGLDKTDVVIAIRSLLNAENVAMDRPAVEAGLALLEPGGNFADGIIESRARYQRRLRSKGNFEWT